MSGPRCNSSCREHPSCALGALVDYLAEAQDAVIAELDNASLPAEVNALEHLHFAHQLLAQTVVVVDHRVADLLEDASVGCAAGLDTCTRHPACIAMDLRQRTHDVVTIAHTVLDDALARCRIPNPWGLTMELRGLVDGVQRQLQVYDLEVAFALPGAAS